MITQNNIDLERIKDPFMFIFIHSTHQISPKSQALCLVDLLLRNWTSEEGSC